MRDGSEGANNVGEEIASANVGNSDIRRFEDGVERLLHAVKLVDGSSTRG